MICPECLYITKYRLSGCFHNLEGDVGGLRDPTVGGWG